MAKASAQITISYIIDIKASYRYYLLQSSTLAKPSKPTAFPPPSTWDDSEPSYVDGSTNSLYFVDCTVFCDDTFSYSEVSLSSSYEAAKQAYNKAQNAQDIANDAQDTANNAQESADSANQGVTDANDRINEADVQIQMLKDSIAMLVTDENGASLMTQTSNGWTFSMGETSSAVNELSQKLNDLEQTTGDTNTTVSALDQAVKDIGEKTQYVTIKEYEDEPCIELGESNSEYALMITNTRIMFRVGSNIPTLINSTGLVTENIEVKNELRHGNYVWMQRSNGHYSLQWKAVSG